MKTHATLAALIAISAGAAQAQSVEDQIRAQLAAQGFTKIEIARDDGAVEVEARRGAQKIWLVYDAETGGLKEQGTGEREDHDDDGVEDGDDTDQDDDDQDDDDSDDSNDDSPDDQDDDSDSSDDDDGSDDD